MTKIEYRNALLQDAMGKGEFCVHSSELSFGAGSYIRLPNGIEYYAVRAFVSNDFWCNTREAI